MRLRRRRPGTADLPRTKIERHFGAGPVETGAVTIQEELEAATEELKRPPVILAPLLLGFGLAAAVQALRGSRADEWVFGGYAVVLLAAGFVALRKGLALTGQRNQSAMAILPLLVGLAVTAGLSELNWPHALRMVVPMLVSGVLLALRDPGTGNRTGPS